MSDYGLDLYNNNNAKLIDATCHANVVAETGTVTSSLVNLTRVNTDALGSSYELRYLSYGYRIMFNSKTYSDSRPPLIAVNSSAFTGFGEYIYSDGNIVGCSLFTPQSATGSSINYVVLGIPLSDSSMSGNYGLATYDAAGNKLYDSRYRSFILKAASLNISTNWSDTGVSYSHV